MKYIAQFDIGDPVTLKTDHEKLPRIVTGISIRQGTISYDLACGAASSWHHDFEIEGKKKQVKIGFIK